MVTKNIQFDEENICFNTKYAELSKKWSLIIIKDLFLGCKHFNDFLKANPLLSNKVLSDQLKRLELFGYITKKIVSITPIKAEYALTEMGRDVNKIAYEKLVFGLKYGFIDKKVLDLKGKSLEEIFSIKK